MNFLQHLLALDIAWLIGLVMNNLLWVFMFTALMFIIMDGKRVIYGVILISFVMWIWSDFENASGWLIFVGAFLLLHYMLKLAVFAFAENSPTLQRKLILVNEIQGIGLLLFFNFFMR